jgi:hypothetical protein
MADSTMKLIARAIVASKGHVWYGTRPQLAASAARVDQPSEHELMVARRSGIHADHLLFRDCVTAVNGGCSCDDSYFEPQWGGTQAQWDGFGDKFSCPCEREQGQAMRRLFDYCEKKQEAA